MYKKGDIVSVYFPYTDNSKTKLRPALIVSNETVHNTGDYMIVQITSKPKNDGLNLELRDNDLSIKLPLKSYLRVHKVFVIEKELVIKKISSIKSLRYKAFINALNEIVK